ncbi:hypothetical protein O3M35_004418 [Rhynocoris fuscipes]|uniref:Kinectin n=1 Tax=Rhynocoris fuscipes TaxID=488301 RepID=A0AAW1CG72_9HEMI
MDIQIALICLAVAAISAFMFYFSFSKKPTFEEVKANRRKIMKQFQEDNKTIYSDKGKDKKPKKVNKKKSDKKDVRDSEIDISENETKKESSQAKPSPLLNNPAATKVETVSIKDKKKLVQNKESGQKSTEPTESQTIQQNKTDITNDKPIITKENKKKMKKDHDKDDKKNQSEQVEDIVQIAANTLQNDPSSAIQQVLPSNVSISNSQSSKPKPSKKKRIEINSLNQLKNDNQAVSHQVLMSLIDKSELSGSEIHTLIERLLNKQQGDISEWYSDRQDPMVKLKKQLNDTEQALKDEKQITVGLQAKLKELRQEIINDRQQTRSAEEQIHLLQNEIRSLTNKLHNINDEKNSLNINLQQLQKKFNENELLIQMKEDQIIKQRLNDEKNHETVINLQAQVNQLTAQIQENMRVIEEYQKMHADVTRAYEGSQFSVQELQAQIKTMERSISDAKIDIENQTKANESLFKQNEQLSNQLKNQCQEINTLREKNESLSTKLSAENFENGITCNKQDFVELEARLEERNNQIDKLTKEVEYSKSVIQDLNNSLVKDRNDLINNQLLLEKANNEILSLKERINLSIEEDAFNQLKFSLNERNQEIASLKHEIEMCKEKNNENDGTNLEIKKIHEKVNKLMKNLYPDLHVECNQENTDDWLANLEKTVMSRITQAASNKQSLSELQTHNSHLQSLVIHYKGIITEAEKMLNQLQKKVEIEEARWKAKVKSLEETLAKLRTNHSSEMFLQP